MFNNISQNYPIGFELQRSYFLRDCLKEEISYELKDENIIIYKKYDNGISEEISLDELIFYIHTEVADKIKHYVERRDGTTTQFKFYQIFKDIDNIKKAVENMKIILKYDDFNGNDCGEKDESDLLNYESKREIALKRHADMIRILSEGGTITADFENISKDIDKETDNESLAF